MSSSRPPDEDLRALLGDLTETLDHLQRNLERTQRRRSRRPPRLQELVRFTTDVTIPAAILVLETNVRALQLLRRSLEFVDDRDRDSAARKSSALDARASEVGDAALGRLGDALTDVQRAIEGEPTDEQAQDLLADARELQTEIRERIAESAEREDRSTDADDPDETDRPAVDVDAELESIKADVEDDTTDE